jgi:hypothetical protein
MLGSLVKNEILVYMYVGLFLYYTAALYAQYTAKFLLLNSATIEIYNSLSKVL